MKKSKTTTATQIAMEMLQAKNETKLDLLIRYYQHLIDRLTIDRDSIQFLKAESIKIHNKIKDQQKLQA